MNRSTLAVAVLVAAIVTATLVLAQGTPILETDTRPGQRVFDANCLACHQATGAGITAAFPPLKGHVPELLAVEGGRRYVIDVVLFGLAGPVTIAGHTYDGMMPAWGHLSDGQLADVLNFVATAWDNRALLTPGFAAFTASEVLDARADALDARAVHAARQALDLE